MDILNEVGNIKRRLSDIIDIYWTFIRHSKFMEEKFMLTKC